MFNLHHFVYGFPNIDGRFDDLVARAMLRMEPRLTMRQLPVGDCMGEFALKNAAFKGLLGDACVVEHAETGVFKVIDYQDSDNSVAVQLSSAPEFAGALYTMFHRPNIEHLFGAKAHLVQPGFFLDQQPSLTRMYRDIVRQIRRSGLDERLLFRGTVLTHRHGVDQEGNRTPYQWRGQMFRQVAVVLQEKYPDEVHVSDEKLPRPVWFLDAASHRAVLALPGHPWCYREFELFSLGIPVVSYPWHTHVEAMALPAPGVHYVATRDIKREVPGFVSDPEEGADAIVEAWRKARLDPSRLERIGRAAQEWYDRTLSPDVLAAGVLRFLNLDGPEWRVDQPSRGALAAVQSMEAER